jgi:shikimate dehydrogenase
VADITQQYGIIGRPVGHSLSPKMHNDAFLEMGIGAHYGAFEPECETGASLVQWIHHQGLAGGNITAPFKEMLFGHLHGYCEISKICEAVNVVLQKDGKLFGYNTDAEGFCLGFEQSFGPIDSTKSVLILGTGGAARGIATGLARRGVRQITFLNRTPARSEHAVLLLQKAFQNVKFKTAEFSALGFKNTCEMVDLIVNCTATKASAEIQKWSVAPLKPATVWIDINYFDDAPPQIEACKKRGLQTQDGMPMLVHQAALSFALFTGRKRKALRFLESLG